MPPASHSGSLWQSSLSDLANIVQHIRRRRAFGRLSLRNTERLGIVHLYFRAGKLIHIVGNHGDGRSLLQGLKTWTRGTVRFEGSVTPNEATIGAEHEQLFEEVLAYLQAHGIVTKPVPARVIESSLIADHNARLLITPWEWRVLVEATRRVSMAVARLVGPQEALRVLQDIIDDCSTSFPAFASLKIAPTGYLQVLDRSHLDRLSREDIFEGFSALIAICQCFCSSLIGEKAAQRLIIQALQDVGPVLVHLGILQMDIRLLPSGH
ncbi:DUF4388 domain-containing protein [Ktedonosporobacter rubrisoli]|uniref:DUF4388 domain-containing protein n=1 Tax=Ktedonosporobacter rubrisoli TaxID=2509675 RepID=A0A4P6JS91_KTERU|nr:DUF4388 domain-containing protein [Ktedonosporobacter rubrisoli]QBD78379.1 DUF4388 domain-containing protein [Ktedonosporobacter rubrisoli]